MYLKVVIVKGRYSKNCILHSIDVGGRPKTNRSADLSGKSTRANGVGRASIRSREQSGRQKGAFESFASNKTTCDVDDGSAQINKIIA